MSSIPVITIDGPSGTGKGTLALALKSTLGWHFLDSGALYRVLAYFAEQQGLSFDEHLRLGRLAEEMPIEFVDKSGEVAVILADKDVTSTIRTEEAGRGASLVAAIPEVREGLFARQRAFRQAPGLVADGRDMGTVVFADANLKLFLTASPEQRAQRRHKQLIEKGMSANLARLREDILERDQRDAERSISPLKPASDAIILDTTSLDIESVTRQALALVQDRGLT
ncbi:MAG: (d)CMP kinase [Pseudomonadota bacterium]